MQSPLTRCGVCNHNAVPADNFACGAGEVVGQLCAASSGGGPVGPDALARLLGSPLSFPQLVPA